MKRKTRPENKKPVSRKKRPSLPGQTVARDNTNVDYIANKRIAVNEDKGVRDSLVSELGVTDEELKKGREYVSGILKNEQSGDFTDPRENILKKYAGTGVADVASNIYNKLRGEETAVGEYNIHPSSVPEGFENKRQSNQALSIVMNEYRKARNKNYDPDTSFKIAVSAYNKGSENAFSDALNYQQSEYSKRIVD